jgi:hypothetical protein
MSWSKRAKGLEGLLQAIGWDDLPPETQAVLRTLDWTSRTPSRASRHTTSNEYDQTDVDRCPPAVLSPKHRRAYVWLSVNYSRRRVHRAVR